MCGRYVSSTSLEELVDYYGVEEVRTEPLPARFNVAPTQPIYAVASRRSRPDDGAGAGAGAPGMAASPRLLGAYRWGLVPSWAKDLSIGSRLINARAEGITDKPAFRSAFSRRRCVIPADCFYEWKVLEPSPDGKKRGRLPHVVRRAGDQPLSFAGIWEVWRDPADPGSDLVRTAAIVTTAANGVVGTIHDRMPVVLDGDALEMWLDPSVEDPDRLRPLLVPSPDDGWEVYPVSTLVNTVTNEGPELLAPLPAPPGDRP